MKNNQYLICNMTLDEYEFYNNDMEILYDKESKSCQGLLCIEHIYKKQ